MSQGFCLIPIFGMEPQSILKLNYSLRGWPHLRAFCSSNLIVTISVLLLPSRTRAPPRPWKGRGGGGGCGLTKVARAKRDATVPGAAGLPRRVGVPALPFFPAYADGLWPHIPSSGGSRWTAEGPWPSAVRSLRFGSAERCVALLHPGRLLPF